MLKRFLCVTFAFVLLTVTVFNVSCGIKKGEPLGEGFVVRFYGGTHGEIEYVGFPDGRNLLIDCGKTESDAKKIIKDLQENGKKRLDYLVLSNPSEDSIGGAKDVINAFEIGKAFIPELKDFTYFPFYKETVDLLKEKGVTIEYGNEYSEIIESEYCVLFLSPNPREDYTSEYLDLDVSFPPTMQSIKNVSAVIYVEYKNVRFLFTGDIESSVEDKIRSYYKTGIYDRIHSHSRIILDEIDFLKVSNHGNSSGLNQEFFNLICPSYAVFEIDSLNVSSNPSSAVLNGIINANAYVEFLRTDVCGTVTVKVDRHGDYEIK